MDPGLGWLERLDPHTQAKLARIDHINREAVAVGDDWRGQGIAGMLLERIAARARAVGIEHFTALCLATNDTVIRLLSRLGQTTITPDDAGIVKLRMDLTGRDPGARE